MECMYKLLTFGIPRDAIPLSDDGTLYVSNHHKMLQAMQNRETRLEQPLRPNIPEMSQEEARASETSTTMAQPLRSNTPEISQEEPRASEITTTTTVLVPAPMDIIMGRGRRPRSQAGALRMHSLLLEHHDAYEAGAKFEKIAFSHLVLQKLRTLGCRFLKQTSCGFVECDEAASRAKIAHGFRNIRWQLKEKNSQQEAAARKRSLIEETSVEQEL
jgi:hypothetical protein